MYNVHDVGWTGPSNGNTLSLTTNPIHETKSVVPSTIGSVLTHQRNYQQDVSQNVQSTEVTESGYRISNTNCSVPSVPQNGANLNGTNVNAVNAVSSRRSSFHPIAPATYSMSPAFGNAVDNISVYGCGYGPYVLNGYHRGNNVGSRRLSGLLDRVTSSNLELPIESQTDIGNMNGATLQAAATKPEATGIGLITKCEGIKDGIRDLNPDVKPPTFA